MNAIKLCVAVGVIGMLAACAQQEEPPVIKPQPVYNKFGEGSCEGEWIYVPGAAPQFDECVPPEDCDPVYAADGSIIECPPPPRYPDPGGGDDDDRGRTATGAPRT